jgi:hypothetical protein
MAYSFNGTNQYLSLPSGDIPSPTLPVTIAALFYDADTTGTGDRSFSGYGRSTTNTPQIRIRRPTNVRNLGLQVRDDANLEINSLAVAYTTPDVWHHGGGVFDTSARRVYVNGTAGTLQTTTIGTTTLDQFAIGALLRTNVTFYWFGRVAEVAVWAAILSDEEMTSLSKGFKPPRIRPQSLLYYSPLIRDLQDVREARTITNNNSATVADHPRVY